MKRKVKLHLLVDVSAAARAAEILSAQGMNLSEAVNLMLHQVCIAQGLPFEIRKTYKSMEELWVDLPKA
ncbi:MAG: type II toxin-antitoxin system RelB/DinJ family antitoxin [Defluviitaleaceae bacterium]|nr:type II toxin-antitoxin system RelB/DinJ family antitoxin [Defluviitaleaceae bacterium]MCL2274806.1 type II toxin-antitoxin system RelB/DinJ family antitoxin [Defluviitaleaceae bacterium]